MLVLRVAAEALACGLDSPSLAPADVLVWPLADPVPPETILVVRRFGAGAVGPLRVLTPARTEVPVARVDLSATWAVLTPTTPLTPGTTYTLVASTLYSDVEFTVSDVAAEPVGPALSPVQRQSVSEVLTVDCPDAPPRSAVTYDLCAPAAVLVAATGDAAPVVPASLADLPGMAALGSGSEITLASGLSADLTQTVWLGAFDGVGRFRGWFPDELAMPGAGTVLTEQGAADCGEWDGWQVTAEETCLLWDEALSSCVEDENVPQTPEPDCGCASGAGPSPLALALLAVVRRRRA